LLKITIEDVSVRNLNFLLAGFWVLILFTLYLFLTTLSPC